jgi:hypothetical protein
VNQHALIIGVESYRDPQITPVRFARAEAEEWERLLKGTCQFETVKVLAGPEGAPDEPTLSHVVDALYEIATGAVRAGDHFVLVFGGHGAEVNGRGYLMLSDCRSFSRSMGTLSLEALREDFLKRMPARWCTVILDSCRNDPEAGRGDGGGELGSDFYRDLAGLGERRRRDGRMTTLMSACKPGQRAHASNRFRKGVWSHFLHEGIRGAAWKDGVLRLRDLARYAHAQVCGWAATEPGDRPQQEPWMEQWGTGEEVELARDPGVAQAVGAQEDPEPLLEPLPEGGFSWYHGSPLYLSRMAPKCVPGLWLGDRRVETQQTEWLVRQGVAEVAVRQGELVAASCPEALIAGGQIPLLRDWLGGLDQRDALAQVLERFLADEPVRLETVLARVRDPELATRMGALIERWQMRDRPEFRRMPEPIRGLGKARLVRWRLGRVLSRAWDKGASVEEWFERWMQRTPESPILAGLWAETALEAAQCLGDHALVVRFADRMSGFCEDTTSILAVAELVGRHLGQMSRAGELIQKAELAALSPRELSGCAFAWQRLQGEAGPSQRCAEAAARSAEECPDWLAVAKARWFAGRDPAPVREALQRADHRVVGVLDRVALAEAWVRLLAQRREAERALLAAEPGALEASDWFLLGDAWGRILEVPAQASRCLDCGIGHCQAAFDWRTCAVTARELGVDPKAVRECVEHGAGAAVDSRDWCWVADAARTALDSRIQAEEYLGEARRRAQKIGDWLWCARMALEPEAAVEPLEAAERLARDPDEWRRCAEAWVRCGLDPVRARRCLLRAELASRSVLDWKECAEMWHGLLLDSAGERRCERTAGELAGRRPSDQTTLSTLTEIPTQPDDR